MILCWTEDGWNDYLYWQKEGNKKTVRRINKLITNTKRHPFTGLGKPEGLKNQLSGFWSRRIDASNRLIYTCEQNKITIYSCKDHY